MYAKLQQTHKNMAGAPGSRPYQMSSWRPTGTGKAVPPCLAYRLFRSCRGVLTVVMCLSFSLLQPAAVHLGWRSVWSMPLGHKPS